MKCLKAEEYVQRISCVQDAVVLHDELEKHIKQGLGAFGRTACDRIIRACNQRLAVGAPDPELQEHLVDLVELAAHGYGAVPESGPRGSSLYLEKIIFHILQKLVAQQAHGPAGRLAEFMYLRLQGVSSQVEDFGVVARNCFAVLWNGSSGAQASRLSPRQQLAGQLQALRFRLLETTCSASCKVPAFVEEVVSEYERACGSLSQDDAAFILSEFRTRFFGADVGRDCALTPPLLGVRCEAVVKVCKPLCKNQLWDEAVRLVDGATECVREGEGLRSALELTARAPRLHRDLGSGAACSEAFTDCARILRALEVRVGTLNVGTMTGKGREVADMMEKRKVDMLCVQETKWKGSKSRNIGGGFKLFYHGVDGKRNGVGVILKEEYSKSVVEVKRVSDRVMIVKLEVEGMMINVISAYAPQVDCEMKEKKRFWSELDEVVEGVPRNERLVIGADFNGHVGEGNRGDEEVMGRYGLKERNVEGQMVVDFAKRMEMAVVNTYFKKKEDHRVTYKSGGRCTQVDYMLCRRCNLKEIGDCKVLAGDTVDGQHRLVVCRMVLEVKKKRRSVQTERRIRWWKLKEEDCSVRFSEEFRQELGGGEEVLDDCGTTAGVMRETATKEDKETWWNEEVQESIRRKRLEKRNWDQQSDEKSRPENKDIKL
ncbi:separin isoform X1 [Silurus asotus]|uniref:Separin isoform X1 n=1 Tax=Silurus asotus TaxID=30991 RepID=A0AAD5FMC3_SILAS|nr:separin isoform X1 [Silurus asotus]